MLAADDPDSTDEAFFIEEDDILRTVLRRIPLGDSTAYDERVVIHCPFCGIQPQSDGGLAAGVQH